LTRRRVFVEGECIPNPARGPEGQGQGQAPANASRPHPLVVVVVVVEELEARWARPLEPALAQEAFSRRGAGFSGRARHCSPSRSAAQARRWINMAGLDAKHALVEVAGSKGLGGPQRRPPSHRHTWMAGCRTIGGWRALQRSVDGNYRREQARGEKRSEKTVMRDVTEIVGPLPKTRPLLAKASGGTLKAGGGKVVPRALRAMPRDKQIPDSRI
jgi:hypothetical protein